MTAETHSRHKHRSITLGVPHRYCPMLGKGDDTRRGTTCVPLLLPEPGTRPANVLVEWPDGHTAIVSSDVLVPVTAPKKQINSRAKGVRGELEFAKALTAAGYPAERGQQRKGSSDSPDVLCPSLSWVHWEVKRMADCKLFSPATVEAWDAQARRDCGTKHPVIAHRWDGQSTWWVRVTTSTCGPFWQTLEDFLRYLPERT